MNLVAMDDIFDFPFMESAVVLRHVYFQIGRETPDLEVRVARRTQACYKEAHMYRSKTVSIRQVLKDGGPDLQYFHVLVRK